MLARISGEGSRSLIGSAKTRGSYGEGHLAQMRAKPPASLSVPWPPAFATRSGKKATDQQQRDNSSGTDMHHLSNLQ